MALNSIKPTYSYFFSDTGYIKKIITFSYQNKNFGLLSDDMYILFLALSSPIHPVTICDNNSLIHLLIRSECIAIYFEVRSKVDPLAPNNSVLSLYGSINN